MMIYKRNIKLDYLHTFIRNLNFTHGIWLIFLAFKGFNIFEIGIFEMVFHITSLTMEVPTGMIADVYGRKFSRALGILSFLIYVVIMVFSTNFTLILIGFIFCGLSYTLESGSGEALVYDSLKLMNEEDKFMKVNGKKEVLYQLASGISLLAGGWIAMVSFELTFQVTFGVYLITLFITYFMIETPILKSKVVSSFKQKMYNHYLKSTKIVFENKRLLLLIITLAVMAAPITTIFLYLQIHFTDLGYSKGLIGVLLGLHSFFAVIGGVTAYKLEEKYKEKKILYFIPLFITLSFWLILVDEIIFVPFVLLGFFDSVFFVVMGDYINKITPSETRATVLSFSGLSFSIVMIIIFPLVGLIGHLVSLKLSFYILAIVVTIFYLLLLRVLSNNHLNHN